MIRQLKNNEFNQALNFANKIFFIKGENDFLKLHPKVYNYPDYYYVNHYIYEIEGKMVGLYGGYPFKYHDLMILGIGTVCVDSNHRNLGIMNKMFSFIDTNISPNYDLLFLMGDKKRYENFGFYKSGQKITFRIKDSSFKNTNYIKYSIKPYLKSDQSINQQLFNIYENHGKVIRPSFNFYDALKTLSYEIYLISNPNIEGYLVYDRKNNIIKEIITNGLELIDVLINFKTLIDHSEILYEVSPDDKNLILLYTLSDNYHISNLANIKVINYINVIKILLSQKSNLKKGVLTIKIINKVNLSIIVDDEITVNEAPHAQCFDLVLNEQEAHTLLFDNHFFLKEIKCEKQALISSYFPLILPVTMTSIDGF